MTGRAAYTVLLLAACGAKVGPGGDDTNSQNPDAKVWRDAATVVIDAPPDARPCMGGTKAQVAPDGSCFVFVSTPLTYNNAKAACTAMNAHLAFLKTSALDTFAQQFVGTANTWIGATDRVTEGTFLWDDGSGLSFSNWTPGEPNNAGGQFQEDCAMIPGARPDKRWDDRPCDPTEVPTSGSFAYLCQY